MADSLLGHSDPILYSAGQYVVYIMYFAFAMIRDTTQARKMTKSYLWLVH